MLLNHARARAYSHIHQSSVPLATYPKTADVPNEDAEDWEPVPFIPEQTVAASFREDGKAIIDEEPDV